MARDAAPDEATRAHVSESYGKLPLQFEANEGQTDPQVKFISKGSGYNLFLTPTEAVLALHKPASSHEQKPGDEPRAALIRPAPVHQDAASSTVVRMQLAGANPQPHVTGVDEQAGKTNYFIGNDPKKWRTNVANYSKVKYEGVYPGIDLVYYGNQQQLEYDFVVAPNSDPKAIRLKFSEAQKVRIDKSGELVIKAGGEEIRQHKPVIYQEANGEREEIAGRYVMRGREVGFEIAEYDQRRTLMIDPKISYSTYIGGSGNEFYSKIAIDGSGNAYITGYTNSSNFPTANALQATNKGNNAFVTKLNATGTQLLYSTYIGGTGTDNAYNIAVDSSGNAYVTGFTNSINFPTVNAAQSTYGGGSFDAFVARLNSSGNALVYSTYLGGSGYDAAYAIKTDFNGNAYITGETNSTNFPTANALQATYGGGSNDAFIAVLDTTSFHSGTGLSYSTYLGKSGSEYGTGIALDSSSNVYVTGFTTSTNFPTQNAVQPALAGSNDAFVTKLIPFGNSLYYSTYLGGSGNDVGFNIAVDSSGNAYVTGKTNSTNFPRVNAVQSALGGGNDAFVTKLNSSGTQLLYSTYIGGSGNDEAYGLTVNSSGNAFISGYTASTNFPTVNAVQPAYGGGSNDAFVAKLNSSGNALSYSTYLGGSGADSSNSVALDSFGNAYVTGETNSTNFPTTNSVTQTTLGGNYDAYVTKIAEITISGCVTNVNGGGISATLLLSGDISGQLSVSGCYSIDVPAGGTYTIEPQRGSIGFSPGIKTLAPSQTTQDISNVNFVAKTPSPSYFFVMNGLPAADVSKVSVTLSGGDLASGKPCDPSTGGGVVSYQCTGLSVLGSYTVTASSANYTFTPNNQGIFVPENANGTQQGQDFTAQAVYTISGRITEGTNPLANVQVSLGGANVTPMLTDANGNYSFTGLVTGGNYTVTPSLARYTFTPPSLPFNNLSANQTAANFAATPVPKQTPVITWNNPSDITYGTRLGVNQLNAQASVPGTFAYMPAANTLLAAGTNQTLSVTFTPTDTASYNTATKTIALNVLKATPTVNVTGGTFTFDNQPHPASGSVSGVNGENLGAPTLTYNGVSSAPINAGTYNVVGSFAGNANYNQASGSAQITINKAAATLAFGNLAYTFDGTSKSAPVTTTPANLTGVSVTYNGSLTAPTTAGSYTVVATLSNSNYQAASISSTLTITGSSPTPTPSPSQSPSPTPARTIQFGASTYTFSEADGHATINVTRSGDTSQPASVDYATSDGTAKQRSDYITASGTLAFASGESSKAFQVILIDNTRVDGTRNLTLTLSNPVGADLGDQRTAILSITDNDTVAPTSNPIDAARFFVRAQYLDFLSREPDQDGFDYWTNQITTVCRDDDTLCQNARRVVVSAAFFIELEFQLTGNYVYRMYKAGYGAQPTYAQFTPDRARINPDARQIEASKQAYADLFVQRPEFIAKYPVAMTSDAFVDALIATIKTTTNGAVDLATKRATYLSTLQASGRGAVVRQMAEEPAFQTAEYNRAFVLMQYFGYLKRDPDTAGYQFWLDVLNNRVANNYRGMVCAFITSAEYQDRFSSVITRNDKVCAQIAP